MSVVTTRDALRSAVAGARDEGRIIGLVPTMGALHDAHLSLVDIARTETAGSKHGEPPFIVLTIFVNPLQFGPDEDLDRYPRDLERDVDLATARGVDLVFAPGNGVMYPDRQPDVYVDAPSRTDRLCGGFRPGHFRGVLTVVAKLLNLVRPDFAVFGRKDFMQLVLVGRMVRDLDFTVRIMGAPIVREEDGIAMSSRNAYLSAEGRVAARSLSRALAAVAAAFAGGEVSVVNLVAVGRAILDRTPGIEVDYLEIVDALTLEASAIARAGDVAALAARIEGTRLIDNHTLGEVFPTLLHNVGASEAELTHDQE